MASKKSRSFFKMEGFRAMREKYYLTQSEAIKALDTNSHTLSKLEDGTPLTKATLLKILRKYSSLHPQDLSYNSIENYIIDIRRSS